MKAAGRFFEPSEVGERMAEETRRTRHVPTSLLTQRPLLASAQVFLVQLIVIFIFSVGCSLRRDILEYKLE